MLCLVLFPYLSHTCIFHFHKTVQTLYNSYISFLGIFISLFPACHDPKPLFSWMSYQQIYSMLDWVCFLILKATIPKFILLLLLKRVGFQDHFCQTVRCRSIFGYVFLQLAVVMQYHRKMQSVSTSLSQICPVLRGSTRVRIIEQNLSDVLTVLQGKDDTFRMLLHHFN